jgi:hypothetical protein
MGATEGVDKEEATKAHNKHINNFEHNKSHILAYLDRSLLTVNGDRRAGAALVLYHQTNAVRKHTIGLGSKAEVYDAEMEGLAQAAREAVAYAMNSKVSITHLPFYTDNTSAIQNIFEMLPRAGQERSARFRDTITAYLDVDP